MKNLYIIGNGFDIAHDINCGYWDFRTYLDNNAEEFLWGLERIYGFYPVNDEHIFTEEALQKATKAWEDALYDNMWKTFEDRLGHPDENDIESTCRAAIDAMSDMEFGGIEDTLNQYFESQFRFIKGLQGHLFDWVKQISLDNTKKLKQDFSDTDL